MSDDGLLLSVDVLDAGSGLETDALLAMMPPVSASRPTSVLTEAIWNPATHPRWPPGTKDVDGHDISGQFMRAGQTFMHGGQRWDIHSIADGKIIANEASGDVDKVETRVFTPQQVKFDSGEHPSLPGATVAPPVVLKAGKAGSSHAPKIGGDAGYNSPIVDGDAGSLPHDPSIPLPPTSKLSAKQWEAFGRADQLYYRELMQRYGEWSGSSKFFGSGMHTGKVKKLLDDAKKESGGADAVSILQGAIGSQKGSSSGYDMNLVHLFHNVTPGSDALKQAQKRYARAREVQSDVNGVIAWELFNRLGAPDISLRHKAPTADGFFSHVVKGKTAVMAGLSTSWTVKMMWSEPNSFGTAMPIRHLQLAEQITGQGWASKSEWEMATADRVRVNPDVAAFWSPAQVPEKASNQLWQWLSAHMGSKPAPGKIMRDFAAHLSGKADLPDVVAEPGFELKKQSASDQYVIPPDEFMKHVERSVADNPGKVISEKLPVSELDLKPGDVIEGTTEGLRYLVIDDPGLPKGTIRYVALGKGAVGNYDTPESTFHEGAKLYMTSGTRKKVDLHFDIPKPETKPDDGVKYNPNDWVPSGEPVKLNTLQVGDKVRYDGQDWEITNQSSTITSVKSLTTEQEGTFNPLWKTAVLKSATTAKPTLGSLMVFQQMVVRVGHENEGSQKGTFNVTAVASGSPMSVQPSDLSPLASYSPSGVEKGDTFGHMGKKFTVTTVLKDGTVKAKPSGGGGVQAFGAGHEALKGVFRASSYQLGDKSKFKDLKPGDLLSGSAHAKRPYMKLSSVHVQNLDTGEIGEVSPNKSYAKLVPVTVATPAEAPTTGKEWGDVPPPESKFVVGHKMTGHIGDLEVGDQFTSSGGTVYTMKPSDDPAAYAITWASGSANYQKANPIPGSWVYHGHEPQPGYEDVPSASPKLQPGSQISNWDQLHVGAVVQFPPIDTQNAYQIMGEEGDNWLIKSLQLGHTSPWKKNTGVPGTGLVYLGDDPSVVKGPEPEPVAPSGDVKDAVSDGGLKPFKSSHGPGGAYKHEKFKDMSLGALFVDSGGKAWKLVAKQPDDKKVTLSDGKAFFTADDKLRGKLAVHSKKPVEFVDEVGGSATAAPSPPEPSGGSVLGDVVSVSQLQKGDVFLNSAGGKFKVVGAGTTVKAFVKISGPGKTAGTLKNGSSSTYTLVSKGPETAAPPEPEVIAGPFRASSTPYAAAAVLPPHSVVSVGGKLFYKTEADEDHPSAWVQFGHDDAADMPSLVQQVHPQAPDVSGQVADLTKKLDLATLTPGELFATENNKYMVVGQGPAGTSFMSLSNKHIGLAPSDKKSTVYALKVASKPEPAPGKSGFVEAPADTTVMNAGLQVGDEFIDDDGDHHKVITVSGGVVETMYSSAESGDEFGPSKWSALGVAAVKKASGNVQPTGVQIPKGEHWQKLDEPQASSSLGLKVGDQFVDDEGDVHTVTSVGPGGSLATSWTKPDGTVYGPQAWGGNDQLAVGVNKAPDVPKPSVGGDVIPDYSDVVLTGGTDAGGTTGAQIKTAPAGSKWLLKTYGGNEDRIATELLANAVYRTMGLSAPEAGKYDHQGKMALAYPLVDGEQQKFSQPGVSPKKVALGKGFMTDVLVGNRDFAGLVDDNVLWNGDEPTRIDQGGTFFFRAQGKPKDFAANPSQDLKDFLTKGQGKLGVSVTENGLRAQAGKIAQTMTPGKVDALVSQAGFADKAMEAQVRANLKARVDWLKGFADGSVGLPSGVDIPKGATVPSAAAPAAHGFQPGENLHKKAYGSLAVGDVFHHVSGVDYQVVGKSGSELQLIVKGSDKYTVEKPLTLSPSIKISNTYTYVGNEPIPGASSPAAAAGYGVPVEGTKVDMPIVPYASKWASGGKFAYAHIAELSPGQQFMDKKGKLYTVVGQITDKTHVGQTPAAGSDNTTYAHTNDSHDFIAIPHSFSPSSGSKAGKQLPTRVKLVS